MVGRICRKGRFETWSERVREWWMMRVVSRWIWVYVSDVSVCVCVRVCSLHSRQVHYTAVTTMNTFLPENHQWECSLLLDIGSCKQLRLQWLSEQRQKMPKNGLSVCVWRVRLCVGVCQVLSGAACAPAELVLDCATEWSRISDMTVNYIIAPHSRLHISPRDWIGLYAVCSTQSLFTFGGFRIF